MENFRFGVATLMLGLLFSASAYAQEINGEPGSPGATITIPGDQLPPPPQKFGGKIEQDARNSKPYWPARIVPPKGAPNVLLIITDDAGYGVAGTFGGVIPTPALDRIAQNGLRYTNFHSTALCSPTRAALITGRNHHSAGYGVVAEQATGYPGYDSVITRDKATIGRILTDNGYHTAWFGKNHNTPEYQASQAGPFDQWPTGMGFEYFYGFMGGDTNQWEPGNLVRNTTPIYPYVGKPGWNLMTAMADEAIDYVNRIECAIAGHAVPDQICAGRYPRSTSSDAGLRVPRSATCICSTTAGTSCAKTIFANQKRLGVIPQDAKLTPWPKDLIKEWDQLDTDEEAVPQAGRNLRRLRRLCRQRDRPRHRGDRRPRQARQHADLLHRGRQRHEPPKVSPTARRTKSRCSMAPTRRSSRAQIFLRRLGHRPDLQPHVDRLGIGVRHAISWTSRSPSHFGGTRQGMAISWPKVITDKGGNSPNSITSSMSCRPSSKLPKIKQPTEVDGIKQSPIEGVSMTYTFDKNNANAPSTHKTQYFEMFADRAIYSDGWIASTKVMRAPWVNVCLRDGNLVSRSILER